MKTYQERKEELREEAIEWQASLSDWCPSYSELAYCYEYFNRDRLNPVPVFCTRTVPDAGCGKNPLQSSPQYTIMTKKEEDKPNDNPRIRRGPVQQ